MATEDKALDDVKHEGREALDMDVDRMVNEGLGGGNVTIDNGWIDETTTDTMQAGTGTQRIADA